MTKKTKTFSIEIREKNKDGGGITISTSTPDRDNDRVIPAGARVDDYLKNPVVQWGHNYYDPWATIGKTLDLNIRDDGIDADFDLRPPANDADPQNVIRLLWFDEWINAASIGFRLNSWVGGGDGFIENEFGGWDFLDWELLEWSLVPIPANQEALRLAMAAKQLQAGGFSWDSITDIASELKAGHLSVEAVTKLLDKPKSFPAPKPKDAPSPTGETDPKSDPAPVEAPEMLAWVRRLENESYDGPQTLLATFYIDKYDIPEDAEKMTINAEGEIEMVPHPDAGQTITRRCVNYSPPLKIFDDDWGEDAIYYASSAKCESDEELIEPMDYEDYEIKEMSEVLAFIPMLEDELPAKAWKASMDICRLNAKGVHQTIRFTKQLKAKVKALQKELADTEAALLKAVKGQPVEKAGRVLSAKNEERIRQSQELLTEVLETLPDEEDEDDGKGQPQNQNDEVFILAALDVFKENLSGGN